MPWSQWQRSHIVRMGARKDWREVGERVFWDARGAGVLEFRTRPGYLDCLWHPGSARVPEAPHFLVLIFRSILLHSWAAKSVKRDSHFKMERISSFGCSLRCISIWTSGVQRFPASVIGYGFRWQLYDKSFSSSGDAAVRHGAAYLHLHHFCQAAFGESSFSPILVCRTRIICSRRSTEEVPTLSLIF